MVGTDLGGRLAVAAPRRVVLVSAAHGINEFFSVALPPILPLLVADFGLTYAEAGFLLTVFFVTYSVCQLPAGFLADRVGKVPLIAASVLGLAAGVLLASTAQTFETLLVAQAIGGVSGSAYHPAGMALISDGETGETEGTAMGIHGFGGVAGVALAPVLVGGLADAGTWRLALVGAGVLGIAFTAVFAILVGSRGLDGRTDGGRDRAANGGGAVVDGRGAVDECGPGSDSGAGNGSGSKSGQGHESDGGSGHGSDGGSGHGSVSDHLDSLTALPVTRWLLALLVLQFLVAVEVRGAHSFTTSFAYERADLSTGAANLVFLALLVGSAIASLWAGDLADRMDRSRLGVVAAVLSAGLFGLTPLVPPVLVTLVAWFFVLGLVMYVQLPAMNAITASYAERAYSGGLFGVMATGAAVGGAVAPTLFGTLTTVFDEGVAFAAIGVACLLGAATFAALGGGPFRTDT